MAYKTTFLLQTLTEKGFHPWISSFLGSLFSILVGVSVICMLIMLIAIIYGQRGDGLRAHNTNSYNYRNEEIKGKQGERFYRFLSFFVGLLIVVGLDTIIGLELGDLIVVSFINISKDSIGTLLPPIIVSIIFALFGLFIAWQVHKNMQSRTKAKRYFVLITTVILFYFIRIYVLALGTTDLALIPNLAFILGYAFILINDEDAKLFPNS